MALNTRMKNRIDQLSPLVKQHIFDNQADDAVDVSEIKTKFHCGNKAAVETLKQLEREGVVVNVGTAKRSRFVPVERRTREEEANPELFSLEVIGHEEAVWDEWMAIIGGKVQVIKGEIKLVQDRRVQDMKVAHRLTDEQLVGIITTALRVREEANHG